MIYLQSSVYTMDLRSAHKPPEKPQTRLHLSLTRSLASEDEDPTYSACGRTQRTLRSRSSQKLCLDSNPSSPEDWDGQGEDSDDDNEEEEEEEDDDNDVDYEDNEEEDDEEEEEVESFLKEATKKTAGGDSKWQHSLIIKGLSDVFVSLRCPNCDKTWQPNSGTFDKVSLVCANK